MVLSFQLRRTRGMITNGETKRISDHDDFRRNGVPEGRITVEREGGHLPEKGREDLSKEGTFKLRHEG